MSNQVVYRHYHNHKLYRIITETDASIQEDGVWVPAVIYESFLCPSKIFTRSLSEFHAKFTREIVNDKSESNLRDC